MGFVSVLIDTFDYSIAKEWVREKQTIVMQLTIIYLITIFGIKYAMQNRKAFDLQYPLNVWNAILAVFSILGFVSITPIFIAEIYEKGIVRKSFILFRLH